LVQDVKLCVIVRSNAVRKGLAQRKEIVHVGMGSVDQTATAAKQGTLELIAKSSASPALVQSREAAWETVSAVALNMRLGHHVKSVAEDTLVTSATLGVMHRIRATVEAGALPQEHASVIRDGQARPVMNVWRVRWDTPFWRDHAKHPAIGRALAWGLDDAGETVRANAMETIQARRAKSARLDFLVKRASAIAIPRNIAPEEAGARRRVNVSATSGLRERGARIVLHPSTGQNAKPNARMSNVAWTGHVRMTGPASAARVSRGKDVMLVWMAFLETSVRRSVVVLRSAMGMDHVIPQARAFASRGLQARFAIIAT
jgi:hypothetical protein